MTAPVQNGSTLPLYNVAGTETAATAATSPTSVAEALGDVFNEFASLLSPESGGQTGTQSSLVSQQGNQQLGSLETVALLELALLLTEHISQSAGSSATNDATDGGDTSTADADTSTTNPADAGGDNSNTSTQFSLNLAPATSAQASDFTQAGEAAIDNMPSSTLANVDINAYTHDAMTAMQNAGYTQEQIKNYMTGLYQAYSQRTTPTGGSSGTAANTSSGQQPYNPLEQQEEEQPPPPLTET